MRQGGSRERGAAGPARRALRFAAGLALAVAGAIMLVIPGPGLVALAYGPYPMSEEIPALRRPLDAVRARIGRRRSRSAS